MADLKVVSNTIVLCSGADKYYPTGKEVYGYKFHKKGVGQFSYADITSSECFCRLKIRKQPIDISYSAEVCGSGLKISPFGNREKLNIEQIITATDYGYYIDGTFRFFIILDEDKMKLSITISSTSFSEQLNIVASLRNSGELNDSQGQLVDALLVDKDEYLHVEKNGLLQHKLYPYQRHGVHWLLYCLINNFGTILGDDMGLGKTAQIIALIAESLYRGLAEKVMIVVPNSLLENWRREFTFFCPNIVPYLHFGDIRVGLAESLRPYKVLLMPYTIMTSDINMLEELDIDILVFDEASILKNPRSARRMAATKINARSTIAMTGTPVENNLLDLWSIVDLVNPGYLSSEEAFSEKYIGKTITDTLDNDLDCLEKNVSQIMIRRMKNDILSDLPEKIDIHQAIIMSDEERKGYEMLSNAIKDSSESCVFAEIVKLQKYTSHPFLIELHDKPSVSSLKQSSSKFLRLFELLQDINERSEKVLIFANHIAMIDLLKQSIESEFFTNVHTIDGRLDPLERQNAIDDFSVMPGFSALVLNPKTAGMGLNITAANHVIHYSRQWNPALEEQATARAFRNGQNKNVNAFYLYYANTIEEVIDERLRLKRTLADSVISVVDEKSTEIDYYLKHL